METKQPPPLSTILRFMSEPACIPEAPAEKVRTLLGEALWLNDPEAWDRAEFVEQLGQIMYEAHGNQHQFDELLVGMLVTQVEIYVKCWASIKTEGLVMNFNGGATPGKNLHISMADRALKQVAYLLGELSLSPKTRPPLRSTAERLEDEKIDELMKGPPGYRSGR